MFKNFLQFVFCECRVWQLQGLDFFVQATLSLFANAHKNNYFFNNGDAPSGMDRGRTCGTAQTGRPYICTVVGFGLIVLN